MTDRAELIEDGCDALPLVVWRELSMEDVVEYVLDAVEPLIQVPAWKDGYDTAKAAYETVFAEMRAEVVALLNEAKSNATSTRDFDLHRYHWVFAEGVEAALKLIDGGSND